MSGEDDMHHSSELGTVASVVLMTGALSACVGIPARTPDASIADARISAIVQRVLDQHPDLEPPNIIRVQAVNRVVYLHGQVGSTFQLETAELVAAQAPDVARVENMWAVTR